MDPNKQSFSTNSQNPPSGPTPSAGISDIPPTTTPEAPTQPAPFATPASTSGVSGPSLTPFTPSIGEPSQPTPPLSNPWENNMQPLPASPPPEPIPASNSPADLSFTPPTPAMPDALQPPNANGLGTSMLEPAPLEPSLQTAPDTLSATPDQSWNLPPLDTPASIPQPPTDNSVYSPQGNETLASGNFSNYQSAPQTPADGNLTSAEPSSVNGPGQSLPDQTSSQPTTSLSDLGISTVASPQTSESTVLQENPLGFNAPQNPLPDDQSSDVHIGPTEPAPTDLSQLSGMGSDTQNSYTPPISNPETLVVPPTSPIPESLNTTEEKHSKLPKPLLFGGVAIVILVVLASAYFILGVGKSSTPPPSSLPAQTSQQMPLTNPPQPATPQPQSNATPSAQQGASGFGSFNPSGATTSATTGSPAFNAIKARQATQSSTQVTQ